jgi:uncharacterized protein YjgD (DUF1641 family)
MVKKTDVANKNTHSVLELLDLVKRDELVRLIKKVIDLQKDGTLDKLLSVVEILDKDKTVDKLYFKVNDLSKKGTLTKLLEGNVLDRQLDSLIKLLQDGSLMKLLDLVMDLQKKGLIDELMNYVPKIMVILEKIIDLEKKGVIKIDDINKLIDKLGEMISSGALDTLMDMIDIVPIALSAINSEPVRKLLVNNIPKVLELLQKVAELNQKGLLDSNKIGSLVEKLAQLISDGTVDKLIDKFGEMISSGALDTLMDMIDIVPIALSAINSEPVRKLLVNNIPKVLELLQKVAELNQKGLLDSNKIGSLVEKLAQLISDGTVDKLLEVLVFLSALLDALNDEMIKSVAEKLGKVLELVEPSKL